MISTPLTINQLKIKNRIFKPAMSEQMADKHGNPKASLLSRLYRTWAQGGTGLLLSGNIMVDRDALGEPMNIILDEKSDLEPFTAWVNSAKTNGAAFFAQINHPGKQVPKFLDSKPMGPSAIAIEGPLASGFNPPREMTEKDIKRVIQQFATTAKLCKQAGFDGIELHGAHGYLINQFLSPRHNKRTDKWKNGELFLISVYRQVRAAVGGSFPIIIKLNSSDFEKGGYSETDAIGVMKMLEQEGIDAIEISGGTYESQSMTGDGQPSGGYFLEFAKGARKELTIPLIITGGFQSKQHMEAALNDNIDMVGIGRPLILKPNLPIEIMQGSNEIYQNDMRRSRWNYLNIISMLSWWESQMLRIAKGKQPNPKMHVFHAVIHALTHVGMKAFAPRRG
ncbi:NADH:flavin oxidoreductase/NADH oxidase family protein [Photobacterium sagamiensis]|uniref:NADH:flavin oxidoreductase/NADH oxidase family protein n=1 Tax=Photobacterium sagamiensis TaxID=2910241 RepID=UPI003D0FFD68